VKRLLFLTAFSFLSLAACQLHAQSLRNTNWKTFIGGQLNDTVTLHIYSDSSVATNSGGMILVRSLCTVSGDSLTFRDYDGPYTCQALPGIYKIHLTNAQLTLSMINDACDGRVQSIDGIKWVKAAK
jgi:hypothetical protein